MADRPILFSAPMVRALNDGRKTQTRRVLTPQPRADVGGFLKVFAEPPYFEARNLAGAPHESAFADGKGFVTPYPRLRFAIGDRLWVKETWRAGRGYDGARPRDIAPFSRIWFEADGCNDNADAISRKARPSIFMPRWASRLTLTVTDLRVERLQGCSEADALAEGIQQYGRFFGLPNTDWDDAELTAVSAYHRLWNSINGAGAWEANPWVVAVSFDVWKGNIDG